MFSVVSLRFPYPRAVIMVTTSLAWVRLILAALAIRHSLLSSGSCSRHATTCTVIVQSSSVYHRDAHLLQAGDVVLDLLDEARLVQLIAAVLDVAQEHLGLANLHIFIVYIM